MKSTTFLNFSIFKFKAWAHEISWAGHLDDPNKYPFGGK